MSSLVEILAQRSVVVCCGSGGVGKTTVAAAMALSAAQAGRRTCVVTIDPAKRLADALGLASLTNLPTLVEGDWPGECWALMLDTKGTFDDLVVDQASDQGRAEAILANRVYRNLSSALSGTQEYMASEKLHQLHEDPRFDLVVVDTPPTRNALDFIEAPRRLVRFVDNRVFRAVMTPTRAYLRAATLATRSVLRTMSKAVGSAVVDDAIDFFQAFEGMEEGFRSRAAGVTELLTSAETAFVLVTSPRPDAVEEALYLAERLSQSQITVAQVVANRVHSRFDEPEGPPAPAPVGEVSRAGGVSSVGGPLAVLEANLAELRAVAEREEACLAVLSERVPRTPLVRVPILPSDVHDIRGLSEVARLMLAAS
ncbi:MAG: ArsA family ATPase [Acidimicrobiales bacterium]